MASVAQLKQIIKKNKAGQYWEDYGPFKIGTATVCEIWTIGDGEDPEGPVNDPEIRFSLEGKGGEEKYFECFGDLAEHLNKQFTSAAREGADWTQENFNLCGLFRFHCRNFRFDRFAFNG
jgi:hypothetical protein